MENTPKNQEKKERYKRVPVYTKEHYGSPKYEPPPKGGRYERLIEAFVALFVIVACATYFIAVANRPKQAWEIEKENSEWYNGVLYNLCEDHLKEQLRDPNSYERAGEIKVIKDNGMEKSIAWEFRARNGFGGMDAGQGVCLIKKGLRAVAAEVVK